MNNLFPGIPAQSYQPELPLEQKLEIAKNRLNQIVEHGTRNAGPVVQRILTQVPTDSIVRAKNLRVNVDETARVSAFIEGGPDLGALHKHAFAQLVDRAGINKPYAETLLVGGDDGRWRRDLLQHMLAEHHAHSPAKYLVRSTGGQVRGVLSDSYRRLDSRPLLEAFVTACQRVGAVPVEGVASDLRASVRVVIPTVFEPVPGEAMVFGLSWNNSDFGAGRFDVQAFVLRLMCLNGLVGESGIKKVHLGGRLDENLELSQRTYEHDTKTMASATGDVVRGLLSAPAIENRLDVIRRAHAEETNFAAAWKTVGVTLTKTEQGKVKEAFEGQDVVNLPAGKTLWRFSNALSWVANEAEDPERRIELQTAAGKAIAA